MKRFTVVALAVAIFTGFAATTASAGHEQVYSPCDEPTGYRHLTVEEMQGRVNDLVPHGLDLESVTVTEGGLALSASPSPLLFEAGVIQEFALDHNGVSRHYGDPYWEYRFEHLPNWSFWEIGCTTAALPATTTTSTQPPATTTTALAPTTTEPAATVDLGDGYELPDGYDLWDAEYDGWPFKKTILLLEARYPPNVAGKHYFPLSTAVRFLKQGGMVGGLDFLWNSTP